MLKNIRLHIEKDDKKQSLLEEKLATTILEHQKNNLNSFARNIPSLLPLISSSELQNHSLFCNKFGEINIVDYGLGRALYGFHPKEEVHQQVKEFERHPAYISLLEDNKFSDCDTKNTESSNLFKSSKEYNKRISFDVTTGNIECLVVLGCGLGLHILELIQNNNIEYLIIYEPEPQYFKCSTMVTRWDTIFEIAKAQSTQLFIQIEKDGRDILSDIQELKTHVNIEGFYLYQHYNHPVFNSLYKELTSKPWKVLVSQGISFSLDENYNQYVPIWTPPVNFKNTKDISPNSELYTGNLAALKKYFPEIYDEFKNYHSKTWFPLQNLDGEINIVKKDSLKTWYSEHPRADCYTNFDNFNEQPNKDGLVMGYSGIKLAHYTHFQFVKETEKLLEQAEEELGALPEKVASIIMFGIGVGYQIEKLLAEHSVEKLFLCEPNRDFFYASLFAIDWQAIFEKIEGSDARIYLNIGDDGTNLFRDLLSQFYSIGPYILSNTYFYQSYYNASLNSAISQLREQLQIVISMGEYFDHAYYGIAHTKEGMRRKIPVLTASPATKLSYDDKEVPVFIVGNGPSLDNSIIAIKEWQGQAIIISCGTALQALYKNGITPDFHAEIEQNRSTFDWAVLIGDLEYLKNITLISCNGIHPDTCDLYKDVMIAFKEGESSTVSALNILGRENYQVLQNAFPTVSNFVCDLFSQLGFTTIYLIGVDLGFISVKHHHSKSSGYYKEDGLETYNYADGNNTSLIVPGNFRPTVNTKQEFKVSRQVIEQVTNQKSKDQTFFNCSDGARINGALPIKPDELIIVSTAVQKQQTLVRIKSIVFSNNHLVNFTEKFEKQYSQTLLIQELDSFEAILEKEFKTAGDVNRIINIQKEMLFTSYKNGRSLLFYYLYGTVNYVNALLTKLSNVQNTSTETNKYCNEAKYIWQDTLSKIKFNFALSTLEQFDESCYNVPRREAKLLEITYHNDFLLLVTDSTEIKNMIQKAISNTFSWLKNLKILSYFELTKLNKTPAHIIYFPTNIKYPNLPKGDINTIFVINSHDVNFPTNLNFTYFAIPELDIKTLTINIYQLVGSIIHFCLSKHQKCVVIPKLNIATCNQYKDFPIDIVGIENIIHEHLFYVCIYPKKTFKNLLPQNGSRGRNIIDKPTFKNLCYKKLTRIETLNSFRQHKKETRKLLKELNL